MIIAATTPAPKREAPPVDALGHCARMVGAVGGPADIVDGVETIAHAENGCQIADGATHIAAGTAQTVASTAVVLDAASAAADAISLTSAAHMLGGLAAAVGSAAVVAVAGGSSAVLSGSLKVVHGIKEKDTRKAALGLAQIGGGAVVLVGAATADPLLVAGGSAVCTGEQVVEHKDDIARVARYGAHKIKQLFTKEPPKACTARS